MAQFTRIFTKLPQAISERAFNWGTDDIYVMLVYGYVPNVDHNHVSDVVAYELDSTDPLTKYVRLPITGRHTTRDDTNKRMTYFGDDVTWPVARFEADGIIIFSNTGDDTTSPIYVYLGFGEAKKSSDTPFSVKWSTAEGIFYVAGVNG